MSHGLSISVRFAVVFAFAGVVGAAGCNGNVGVDNPVSGGGGAGGSVNAGGDGGGSGCEVGILCNGSCVDTYNDTFNCGGCNNICYEGYCAAGSCQNYTSEGCPAGYVLCGGACIDVYGDPYNCGECGIQCGPGGYCDGGICAEESGCVGCGEYVTGQVNAPVCDGYSTDLYEALVQCVCEGACSMQCGGICQGQDMTAACQDCIVDSAMGCGNEFGECSNDI